MKSQRWRDRITCFRDPSEAINTLDYEVAPFTSDALARDFIARHHYLGTYPSALRRFGLYARGGALAGVAVLGLPASQAVLPKYFPGLTQGEALDLSRFVLLDCVPGCGETWFLGRVWELLRKSGVRGVLAFSDPVPRVIGGRLLHKGHVGTIYQAHNGAYLGRAHPATLYLLPDGSTLAPRAMQKVRAAEKGWRGVCRRLQEFGAGEVWPDVVAWMWHWVRRLCTKLRHPGNHKYAWSVDRRYRPPWTRLPFPKLRPA
jgi:hypothetical protein